MSIKSEALLKNKHSTLIREQFESRNIEFQIKDQMV